MEVSTAVELGKNALWMTLTISAPILVIGLLVGLLIALFQAVTQLQEQSLTFVPKIASMIFAAIIFVPWIAERVISYAKGLFGTVPWQ